MKTQSLCRKRGFTLLETVIAIGVLSVLLTGFIVVFAPAAAGIKKSIDVDEANRLASTLEEEMVTLRGSQETTEFKTGFGKAFDWIENGATQADDAILIYQYRCDPSNLRADGTPTPVTTIGNLKPGQDFIVRAMARRKGDSNFQKDLPAVDGGVYLVKCTQLIFKNKQLTTGKAGEIEDPKTGTKASGADDYPEAVIAFSADFYPLPAKSETYFNSRFPATFKNFTKPVFTRNLAARR